MYWSCWSSGCRARSAAAYAESPRTVAITSKAERVGVASERESKPSGLVINDWTRDRDPQSHPLHSRATRLAAARSSVDRTSARGVHDSASNGLRSVRGKKRGESGGVGRGWKSIEQRRLFEPPNELLLRQRQAPRGAVE